jgi:hypothetical protein
MVEDTEGSKLGWEDQRPKFSHFIRTLSSGNFAERPAVAGQMAMAIRL